MHIQCKYMTDELAKEVTCLRHDFHQFPEEGYTEYRTSGKIADYLLECGYKVTIGDKVCKSSSRMGVPSNIILQQCEKRAIKEGLAEKYINKMKGGQTGVVGEIEGLVPGNTTVLRFDIDALPINENTNLDFVSSHENIMHACAHDGHTSCGLIIAKLIARNINKIAGKVIIIFQPAEEGCRGAKSIVDNGWLDGVDIFLSGHIGLSCKKLGQIYACNDGFMATTKFNITFNGLSAHAGKVPEAGKNALLAAAVFTENAYAISRTSKGDTRINIGKFISGSGRNIIPDKAYLEVETRGADSDTNEYMAEKIYKVAAGAAGMYDVTYEIEKVGNSGSGHCSEDIVNDLSKVAFSMCDDMDYRNDGYMGASEDVVAMMNHVQKRGGKAAYFLFGTELAAEHHQNTFNFNEEVLPVIIEFYVRSVMDVYNKER